MSISEPFSQKCSHRFSITVRKPLGQSCQRSNCVSANGRVAMSSQLLADSRCPFVIAGVEGDRGWDGVQILNIIPSDYGFNLLLGKPRRVLKFHECTSLCGLMCNERDNFTNSWPGRCQEKEDAAGAPAEGVRSCEKMGLVISTKVS